MVGFGEAERDGAKRLVDKKKTDMDWLGFEGFFVVRSLYWFYLSQAIFVALSNFSPKYSNKPPKTFKINSDYLPSIPFPANPTPFLNFSIRLSLPHIPFSTSKALSER